MAKSPDDELALGSESKKSRRSAPAAGDNSFRVVGTYCKVCGQEDGAHDKDCRRLN